MVAKYASRIAKQYPNYDSQQRLNFISQLASDGSTLIANCKILFPQINKTNIQALTWVRYI